MSDDALSLSADNAADLAELLVAMSSWLEYRYSTLGPDWRSYSSVEPYSLPELRAELERFAAMLGYPTVLNARSQA